MQGYWSRKARDQGILTEKDLETLPARVKVVLDTNILVSARDFPGGRGEGHCGALSRRRPIRCSEPILDELVGILGRKFSRDPELPRPLANAMSLP